MTRSTVAPSRARFGRGVGRQDFGLVPALIITSVPFRGDWPRGVFSLTSSEWAGPSRRSR